MDSAIQWINLYPVDSAIGFRNAYPLESDLSGGYHYIDFEQLRLGLKTGIDFAHFGLESAMVFEGTAGALV